MDENIFFIFIFGLYLNLILMVSFGLYVIRLSFVRVFFPFPLCPIWNQSDKLYINLSDIESFVWHDFIQNKWYKIVCQDYKTFFIMDLNWTCAFWIIFFFHWVQTVVIYHFWVNIVDYQCYQKSKKKSCISQVSMRRESGEFWTKSSTYL